MNVTIEQTEKLLKGNQSFTQFGFSMLLTRLKALYGSDPSQDTLQSCMSEINMFLGKYAAIMSSDFATINNM
jgi:hypothetical protein